MHDAIAAYKEIFLYSSLSVLAVGIGLGIMVTLPRRYYRFTTDSVGVFVHASILQTYVEHYSYQAFPLQNPVVKIYLNRHNQITIILDLFKKIDNHQIFEQIEEDLTELLSCYLGYRKPLFLEITYK